MVDCRYCSRAAQALGRLDWAAHIENNHSTSAHTNRRLMLFSRRSGKWSRYSPDWYTHLTETLSARWHRNLTLTVTLNPNLNPFLTLNTDPNPKIAIMYAVKVTETNLNIVLYIKVIFPGTGWVNQSPKTPRSGNLSGKRCKWDLRANQGFGWGKYTTRWIFIAIKDTGPGRVRWRYMLAWSYRRPENSKIQNYSPDGPANNKCANRNTAKLIALVMWLNKLISWQP